MPFTPGSSAICTSEVGQQVSERGRGRKPLQTASALRADWAVARWTRRRDHLSERGCSQTKWSAESPNANGWLDQRRVTHEADLLVGFPPVI